MVRVAPAVEAKVETAAEETVATARVALVVQVAPTQPQLRPVVQVALVSEVVAQEPPLEAVTAALVARTGLPVAAAVDTDATLEQVGLNTPPAVLEVTVATAAAVAAAAAVGVAPTPVSLPVVAAAAVSAVDAVEASPVPARQQVAAAAAVAPTTQPPT